VKKVSLKRVVLGAENRAEPGRDLKAQKEREREREIAKRRIKRKKEEEKEK